MMKGTVTLPLLLCLATLLGACAGEVGEDPFIRAIARGERATLQELLAQGADPNERVEGFSPLQEAARQQDTEILRILLAHGAKYRNAVDRDGWSPLFTAALSGPPETVDILLDLGADPCLRTTSEMAEFDGKRPSEVAESSQNARVSQLLKTAEQQCDSS
jgi:ankyrin repeat protein